MIVLASILAAAVVTSSGDDGARLPVVRTTTNAGINVTLTIDRLSKESNDKLTEGDDVVIRFEVKDVATKTPVRGARPGAWMDANDSDTRPKSCADRVRVFAAGSLLERAELDLNTFHVVAMNDDATLTVVDPLFGFGGTKLLAMVPLASPAEDWALASDDNRLFVSMPEAKQVALIETKSWRTTKSLALSASPKRLALQPDQAYVWTALPDGVAAIRTSDLTLAATIATGNGPHDFTFSHDSRWLFVANAASVSVIDIRALTKVQDVDAGAAPVSLDWSPLANAAYVASADGTITAVTRSAGASPFSVNHIPSTPGLATLRVVPGGRLVLIANAKTKSLSVLETSSNRIIQSSELPGTPDQISFSSNLAYVRLMDSGDVQMVGLTQLGKPRQPISFADFPAGQRPFGEAARGTPASGIVQAAGESAVLVANGPDKTIYYYEEGMAAPKGSFNNYSREARAVLVVDRSLRERAPGVYETVRRIDRAGNYDVAFFLDTPRLVDCFDVTVLADAARSRPKKPGVKIELAEKPSSPRSGQPVRLRFRLASRDGAAPPVLQDGIVLIFAPGIWQDRIPVTAAGDGTYLIEFTPPEPGQYSAYLRSPQLGLDFTFFGTLQAQ